MTGRRRLLILAAGVILVAGTAAYFSAWRILGVVVSPVSPTRSEIVQTIVASGKVESPSRVDLGSQILGVVANVYVNEGDQVHRGDKVVALNDADARAAVDSARAALSQAETRLRQFDAQIRPVAEQSLLVARATSVTTQRTLDSMIQLAEKSFASRSDLDAAQRARDIAAADTRIAELNLASASPGGSDVLLATAAVSQAKAALQSAETRLLMTSITSPTDGIVIARKAEPGMVVAASTPLVTLAPEGPKKLLIQVDERNLGLIALGQPAIASADAYPNQYFKAVLSFINPAVDPARGSVEVKLTVTDPPDFLKEDMSVSVDVEVLRHADALVLPLIAIRDAAGDKPHVLVIRDSKAVEVPVKLGARGDGKAEILDGITEVDKIITSAATGVTAGQRVRISTATAAPVVTAPSPANGAPQP